MRRSPFPWVGRAAGVKSSVLLTISNMRTASSRSTDTGEALLRRISARRRRDHAVIVVLAVLAVLGGGNAILGVFASGTSNSPDDTAALTIGRSQLASEFAERFVVTYLGAGTTQRDRVSAFVSLNQQALLPSTGRQVVDPQVVFLSRGVSQGGLDVWTVTVSVRLGQTAAPASDTRQYYRVAVAVKDGTVRALSIPAAVQAPQRGTDLALAYSAPCGTETPLTRVASGFLAAFLTGSGDITRYTTADAGISAIQPPPFTETGQISVSADDSTCGGGNSSAHVLATVTPKADGAAVASLAYPMTMLRNGGQWQVRSLDSIPQLRNPLTAVISGLGAGGSEMSTAPGPSTSAVPIPSATQK